MSLHLQIQTAKFPQAWSTVDLSAAAYHSFRLSSSYTAPSKLSFTIDESNHSLPFTYDTFIRFWDDEGKLSDGTTDQSASNPIFEGWVEEITPGPDTVGVQVIAYDPTYRASRMVPLMSGPSVLNDPTTSFPVDGVATYPRLVFNCPNLQDADYAYSLGQNYTLGQIIKTVLENSYLPLLHINAAPGDGTVDGSGTQVPYDVDDTGEYDGPDWVGPLGFRPEEKIVSTGETVRSFIERLLSQYEPSIKLMWEPGTRLWRLHKLPDSTAITVTVNDITEPAPVLSADVRRSSEGRFSSVKVYGPEGVEWRSATWTRVGGPTNTLEPTASSTYAIGAVGEVSTCYWSFTIIDPDFTRIALRGPSAISVPDAYAGQVTANGEILTQLLTSYVDTWEPALVINYGGNYRTYRISYLEPRLGIVAISSGSCCFRWNPSLTNRFELPTSVTLHYPALTEPITVRSPETGYAGTVATIGEIENEYREYNESMAVDFRYGAPVTTSTRIERMQEYADRLHAERKDLVHSGGIQFHGLDYRWSWLGKRVHLAAQDDSHDTLTTGWESIGAWVTDVDYDFEDRTTTISLHTDQMELFGIDPETLKIKLGIRPATYQQFINARTFFSYQGNNFMQTYGVEITTTAGYYDEFGGIQ